MQLYRAAPTPTAACGAHFSSDPEVARHFLAPGKSLFEYEVKSDFVLDARSGLKVVAQAISELSGRAVWEIEEEWWSARLKSVFDLLEARPELVKQLAERYHWIRFDEDFPPGADAWRYLGPRELAGNPV